MRRNPYSLSLTESEISYSRSRSTSPSCTSATSNDDSDFKLISNSVPQSAISSLKPISRLYSHQKHTSISNISAVLPEEFKEYYHILFYRDSKNHPPTARKNGVLVLDHSKSYIYNDSSKIIARGSVENTRACMSESMMFSFNDYLVIEILGSFPEEDFLRGKCFLAYLNDSIYKNSPKTKRKLMKLSDVPEGCTVVDGSKGVYIDKEIADILKPHQISGVQFLYECVMNKRRGVTGGILAVFTI